MKSRRIMSRSSLRRVMTCGLTSALAWPSMLPPPRLPSYAVSTASTARSRSPGVLHTRVKYKLESVHYCCSSARRASPSTLPPPQEPSHAFSTACITVRCLRRLMIV